MKRALGLTALLLAGAAFAALPALGDGGTPTTPETTTAPEPTTTTTTTTTVAPPPAQVLPDGVTIEGVDVGGMTPTAAYLALQSSLDEWLHLVVGDTRLAPTAAQLGAVAYVWGAIGRAKSVAPGTDVTVSVAVKGSTLRDYLRQVAARYDRAPVDARLRLAHGAPALTKDRPGLRLRVTAAAAAIVKALKAGDHGPLTLPAATIPAKVTRASFGPVIVIHRGANRLQLYKGERPWRTFTVATGQRVYPTPLGRFRIVAMWKNPWWYPPASPWAAGEKPIPPGPGNPLGTRWMGISSPGVGIHGTPDAASLGYSASHGCVRMAIPQAEWLFDHVSVGTPVYILAT